MEIKHIYCNTPMRYTEPDGLQMVIGQSTSLPKESQTNPLVAKVHTSGFITISAPTPLKMKSFNLFPNLSTHPSSLLIKNEHL